MKKHSLQCLPIGFCVVLLLVGWPGCSFVVAAQDEAACFAARQDYQVALQSYQDGLLDPAIAAVKTYLRQCPTGENAPQAHYLLAEILSQRENFLAALHHVTQALSHSLPSNLVPHALLLAAQSHRHLGQTEQAKLYLQRVVDAGASPPIRAHALYWLGEFASQQQQHADALLYYRRVIEAQDRGEYTAYAQYALGWTHRQLGDAPAALEAFAAFLALAPAHEYAFQARFAHAILLRQTGQLVAAKAAFASLADQAAVDHLDEVLFWWAETAYQLGAFDEAAVVYQRLVRTHPQSVRVAASLYGWGWAEVRQQDCAAARQPWETLLLQIPGFAQASEVYYQLGVCYVELTLHDLARQHLQVVVEAPSNPAQRHDAILKLARLAFRDLRYAEAVGYYGSALISSPDEERGRLYYVLGESYAALGKYTPAIEQWQQVLASPEHNALQSRALYRIGQAYIEQKAWPQAIPVLRQLWEKAPEFPSRSAVAAYLINAYREIGQCVEALPFYDALIHEATEPQQSLLAIRAKATCLYESKRYADVVQFLASGITAESAAAVDPIPVYLLSQAYLEMQQDEAALVPLSILRKHFPAHPLTRAATPKLAKTLEALGRGKEAFDVWREFLRDEPSRNSQEVAALRLHIGRLGWREGLLAETLDVLAPVRGAGIMPFAVEALFWSGEVYLKRQQWELAMQVYQELMDTYPDEVRWHALASFRMGVIYEQQQDWERALRIYRALQSTTTDGDVRANVQRRITAIEAGRVDPPPLPSFSSSDG